MKNVTIIETELRNSLPALAELINKELGFTPELNVTPTESGFVIESGNLLCELGNTLAKTIFSKIKIRMWGVLNNERNSVWFDPNLKYEHPNGGSNGTNFLWAALCYKIDSCTWEVGRSILNQNRNDEF